MHGFFGPMQPWPSLAEYGQNLKLAQSGTTLFLYDSGPSAKPPLLLIHGLGDKDAVIPVEAARALVAKRPGCQLTVLPEVGHIPQQEAPDAFLEAVLGRNIA